MTSIDLTIARAGSADLGQIAAVIASAIDAWPASARLKRAVLPVLTYDEQDLADHEILLVRELDRTIAVGAWQPESRMTDPDDRISTLLHGLYVARETQTQGLGRWLQGAIASRAQEAGFNGLHVKAERFARDYFVRCGYRQLQSQEQPAATQAAYPYWFWQACTSIPTMFRQDPKGSELTESAECKRNDGSRQT
jgi:GNAT superfamily N-acetyltransferase